METLICACDLDFICEEHTEANDAMTWASALSIRPNPIDSWDAYEGGYKGRYFEGWDAA